MIHKLNLVLEKKKNFKCVLLPSCEINCIIDRAFKLFCIPAEGIRNGIQGKQHLVDKCLLLPDFVLPYKCRFEAMNIEHCLCGSHV